MPVNIVPMSTDAANPNAGVDPLVQAMMAQRQQRMSAGQRMMEAGSRPQPVFNGGQGMMMLANGALGGFLEGRDERNQKEAQRQAGLAIGQLGRNAGLSDEQTRALTALAIVNPAAVGPMIAQMSQRMFNPPETFRQEDRPDGTRIQRSNRTNREEVVQQPRPLTSVSPGQMLVDEAEIRRRAQGQPAAQGTAPAPAPPAPQPGAAAPAPQPGAQQPGVMFQAPGGFRPISEEERQRRGLPAGSYQEGPDGKTHAIGTPQTSVSVTTAANPILKGLGEQFVEQRANARSMASTIPSIHQARSLLDSGITTGFGAERRLDLQRFGSAIGITDPSVVANTEAFRAVMGRQVLAEIKALGANPSNADRDFAERMAAGSIELNEQTIRRMLDIREQAARNVIKGYNNDAGKLAEAMPDLKQYGGALAVPEPGSYAEFQAQQRAAQQQAPQPQALPQAAPPQPDQGVDALGMARSAIERGAPPQAVFERLQQNGIDPRPLFDMMPGPMMPGGQ